MKRSSPYPFEARVRLDGQLVATSRAALRLDEAGAAPTLCFPVDDVDTDIDIGIDETVLDSSAPPGYVSFDVDHPDVSIEIVDAVAGDDERDVTIKQFPTWGDAADLIEVMDVRAEGDATFVTSIHPDHRRSVVEGSQMLGQAIVAAGRHAPDRRVVSASMVFMRVADTAVPLVIELDELSSGRTFTTLAAHVRQGDRLCASGTLLLEVSALEVSALEVSALEVSALEVSALDVSALDVSAPDVISHSAPPPDTPGPYESEPVDMSVTGRDLRVVDGAYTGDPDAPVGPPVLDAWVRFRSVPDDPALHAGLLAQFTGHLSIAAAMRPHDGIGQDQAHRTLSTAINGINISFHRAVRADRWMLYRHLSTYAGDGMTHSECRVHDERGDLLASFTVDAMVRGFSNDRPRDERSAL